MNNPQKVMSKQKMTKRIELGNLVLIGTKASKFANEMKQEYKKEQKALQLDKIMDFKPVTITNGSIQGAWLIVKGNRKN